MKLYFLFPTLVGNKVWMRYVSRPIEPKAVDQAEEEQMCQDCCELSK